MPLGRGQAEVKHSRRDSKNMTVFHNTDIIILCGLDILDLTANQGWAVSIFFHHAFNIFCQTAALPWRNLLKKISWRKSVFLSFSFSCGLLSILLHIFLSLSHVTICSLSFYPPSFFHCFHLLPTAPVPSAFTAVFNYPFLCLLLYFPTPWFEPHPKGGSCPIWLRTGHSRLYFLAEIVIRSCFFFHLLQLLFLIESPCGKAPSLAALWSSAAELYLHRYVSI